MAFVQRLIDVTVTLGTGNFGNGPAGPNDTVKASGLKCSAQIKKAGRPGADSATIRIWGLTLQVMNQITDLGKPTSRPRNNSITLSAGDATSGMSVLFVGIILTAYADFSDPPNACFTVTAMANQLALAKPVTPVSFPGGADVVTAAQNIAFSMGKNLINWGVSGKILANPYFPGTAQQQMDKLAAAAGIHWDPGLDGNPMEIWPWNGARGGAVPKVAPYSGLVGYPQFCDSGMIIRTLYQVGFNYGGLFMLDTAPVQGEQPAIPNANGSWSIISLDYDMETETNDGPWFCDITAIRPVGAGTYPS